MLKKILKYDLKYIYKGLTIFYILDICTAVIARILMLIEKSTIATFLSSALSLIAICLLFLTIGYNLLRLWNRFLNNFYKDESYLTHTLPVEKKTLYTSKFASTIITLATSTIVIVLSLAIIYYSKENIALLKMTLEGLKDTYDNFVLYILGMMFAIFFLELISIVSAGYTGLLLGHKSNDAKMVKSIIIALAFFMGLSIAMLLVVFLTGLVIPDIMDLFMSNVEPGISTIKNVLSMELVLYALITIFYFILDLHIFQKGVNVD